MIVNNSTEWNFIEIKLFKISKFKENLIWKIEVENWTEKIEWKFWAEKLQ